MPLQVQSDSKYKASPPIASLLAVMLLGYVIGLIQERPSGYEFYGAHWAKAYNYSIGTGCNYFQEFAFEKGLEEYSPVGSYRERNTSHASMEKNSAMTIYCSESVPPASLEINSGMQSDEQYLTDEAGAVIGKARWWWPEGSKEISECDIWLSSLAKISEIPAIAAHELGHCWGMQHSQLDSALMAPTVNSPGPTLDDLAGLSDLYGECATVQIDKTGRTFFPAIDPKTLLLALNDPKYAKYAKYEGVLVSGYINPGAQFPSGIYDIDISKCQ